MRPLVLAIFCLLKNRQQIENSPTFFFGRKQKAWFIKTHLCKWSSHVPTESADWTRLPSRGIAPFELFRRPVDVALSVPQEQSYLLSGLDLTSTVQREGGSLNLDGSQSCCDSPGYLVLSSHPMGRVEEEEACVCGREPPQGHRGGTLEQFHCQSFLS